MSVEKIPEPSDERRNAFKPVAAVVAIALVVGLCAAGWLLWQHHEDTQAGRQCTQARVTALKARKDYESLLAGKQVKEAKGVTGEQVKDAKGVTALTDDLKRKEPAMPSCPTGKRDSVLETSGRLGQAEAWYTKQIKTVKTDVKKVLASRDDKTLADAQSVYDSSEGKVADENTRTQLKKALDGKDAKSGEERCGCGERQRAGQERSRPAGRRTSPGTSRGAAAGRRATGGAGPAAGGARVCGWLAGTRRRLHPARTTELQPTRSATAARQ
ncbi:hypothetical protein [Bifidobacterium bombi]|uniref:Uncharacterized protein n=1 Tax=Bifidobacterium bombi DSM 19703 TaxID=1341695 RepID=A0A080N1S2_9BIFI|nr:hypothetical protein [Bifidobacterium bombi]KFF30767.1 hypothetical protein BBOMB_0075 [Bifidobacterium bombi DSM 19703]